MEYFEKRKGVVTVLEVTKKTSRHHLIAPRVNWKKKGRYCLCSLLFELFVLSIYEFCCTTNLVYKGKRNGIFKKREVL